MRKFTYYHLVQFALIMVFLACNVGRTTNPAQEIPEHNQSETSNEDFLPSESQTTDPNLHDNSTSKETTEGDSAQADAGAQKSGGTDDIQDPPGSFNNNDASPELGVPYHNEIQATLLIFDGKSGYLAYNTLFYDFFTDTAIIEVDGKSSPITVAKTLSSTQANSIESLLSEVNIQALREFALNHQTANYQFAQLILQIPISLESDGVATETIVVGLQGFHTEPQVIQDIVNSFITLKKDLEPKNKIYLLNYQLHNRMISGEPIVNEQIFANAYPPCNCKDDIYSDLSIRSVSGSLETLIIKLRNAAFVDDSLTITISLSDMPYSQTSTRAVTIEGSHRNNQNDVITFSNKNLSIPSLSYITVTQSQPLQKDQRINGIITKLSLYDTLGNTIGSIDEISFDMIIGKTESSRN